MTRLLLVLSAAFVLACPWGAEAQGQGARRPRIAVLDFEYGTIRGNAQAIFGTDADVGRGISDLLVTTLVNEGSYSVIERAALDRVLAEQNFSNSERADPSSAARLGRILGVDAIIVGTITQFGNDTRTTGLGGVGSRLSGGALGGANVSRTKAIVAINARIVNVDTAEVLVVAEGRGESSRSSTSLLGGGGTWRGFGAGGVNFGSRDFQNTIIGEAVKEAVDDLGRGVVGGKSRVEVRTIPVDGLVAAVEGKELILNVGRRVGVKVGDQLAIERLSREIKDPASGRVIRRMTDRIGVVRVTDVDDESSVAAVVSGSGFQVGDAVKPAP